MELLFSWEEEEKEEEEEEEEDVVKDIVKKESFVFSFGHSNT